MPTPPYSPVEPVTELLHGVSITDPYRWLEEQESPQTRAWLAAQTQYARTYLDSIPGRERIRERIRGLLDVETYDSIQRVGSKYIFRKRLRGQQQPCIYLRNNFDGEDQLLIDPSERRTGSHTAVKPLQLSPDGRVLLYEVKEGGERTGTFELYDIEKGERLPDILSRGYLRGFAFAPDGRSFYYAHERVGTTSHSAYHHLIGTSFDDDLEIFRAGDDANLRVRLVPGEQRLGFLVSRFDQQVCTDFYLWALSRKSQPELVIDSATFMFGPLLLPDRILAITDRNAPNCRIVEVPTGALPCSEFVNVIPENDGSIRGWTATDNRIYVAYTKAVRSEIQVFDLQGKRVGKVSSKKGETLRIAGASPEHDEIMLEEESFTKPIQIRQYSAHNAQTRIWTTKTIPFDAKCYGQVEVGFPAKDGTRIRMFLVGLKEVLASRRHRVTIMTSYGGYGVPVTPQFSVFVAYFMQRGCLFALPNIRGGSEYGASWHIAAKRQKRQVAIDDFLKAAEWLIEMEWTTPQELGIFGGSNSGLLVGAALTQRPELFRVVVCLVPLLDMLRYHLFDNAHVWVDEYGTADHAGDFHALAGYSPYHRIENGVAYPATMIVSGDADRNCNPLHARKMTARLQAANRSASPILLHYSPFRGHSPVLPLSERIDALTDRVAFLCDQFRI
jgi:prolyl oligopeptidase